MIGPEDRRRDGAPRIAGRTRWSITVAFVAALATSCIPSSSMGQAPVQVPPTADPKAPPYFYETPAPLDQAKPPADNPVLLNVQGTELRAGDRLILKQATAALKSGDTVLATAEQQVVFTLVKLERYQGIDWYLLESDMVTGWAQRDALLPFTQATSYLTDLIQGGPQSPWAFMARGSVRLAEGDPELALTDFDTSIQADPTRSLQYTDYGRVQFLWRANQPALDDFTEALRWQGQRRQILARTYLNRGVATARLGLYDAALADLDRAVSLFDEVTRGMTYTGNQIGDRFTRVHQNLDEAYLARGGVQLALGLGALAESDFRQIVSSAGKAAADTRRGDDRTARKQYDRAISAYKAAIQDNARFVPAYVGEAVVLELQAWQNSATSGSGPPPAEAFRGIIERLQEGIDRSFGETGAREHLNAAPGSVDARVVAGTIAAYTRIAWQQATCPHPEIRDAARAVENARVAVRLTSRRLPGPLNSLAAAYARAGGFDGAIRAQTDALGLLSDDSPLVDDYTSRLYRYLAKQTVEATSALAPDLY